MARSIGRCRIPWALSTQPYVVKSSLLFLFNSPLEELSLHHRSSEQDSNEELKQVLIKIGLTFQEKPKEETRKSGLFFYIVMGARCLHLAHYLV